jgi:hypothetical protein
MTVGSDLVEQDAVGHHFDERGRRRSIREAHR